MVTANTTAGGAEMGIANEFLEDDGFTDRRTFLVSFDDKRLPYLFPIDFCGTSQDSDSPIYLVIGPQAPDAKCTKLAERFGLDAADVIAFRNSLIDLKSH